VDTNAPDHDTLISLLLSQTRDVALILLDSGGSLIGWEGACERIFGYTRQEVLGHPFDLLFIPEDRALGIPAHELAVAAANSKAEDDRWHVRKDGTRIWMSGITIPLRGAEREILAYGKIARDRTDLKSQIDTLTRRVQVLSAADQERAHFLKTLGHELRNPLAPLMTSAALLRRLAPGAGAQGPLATIERQIAVIKRLAEDLTELTRMGAGKLSLQFDTVHLQELLQAIVAGYLVEAQRRGLALQLLVPGTPIQLTADTARLQQMIANLLQNALKYTPSGGRIWVKAATEEDEVVIRVEDTGVGISPEMLPKIFDLFTQEAPNSIESEGGLGIGLALVTELAKLHGGFVEVRSQGKGQGSEFTVRLPLSPAASSKAGDDVPP
jgi:PAS domain S-box-containing protein